VPEGVIAQPSAPQFSPSHALIWSSPGTQAIRWDADPNAHRKAAFCLGIPKPGACSHRYSRFSFLIASHTPPGKSIWLECPYRPACAPLYIVAIRRYRCILASFSAHIGLDHDDLTSRIGRKSFDRSVG
jgi:hypothetical protein